MSTGVPERLVGVWARESIALDGGDPAEPQVVRYLQAARAYADLRLDAGGSETAPMCFAGTTAWDPVFATWHHEVDLDVDVETATDRGEVAWLDGGRWSERGTFASPDGPIGYVEVWRPLPVGQGGLLALRCAEPPARLVQVGGHALAVADRRADGGGFAARYDRREGDAWHTVLSLGDATSLPTPPDDPPPVGEVLHLAGLDWVVDEAAGSVYGTSRPDEMSRTQNRFGPAGLASAPADAT